jgi:transcriptional regulator with XRE-family HTH domain
MRTYTRRQRESLERMTPERRAKVEAIRAEIDTPERRAEEEAIHTSYQEDRPSPEGLIRRGEVDPERPSTMGGLMELFHALSELKRIREAKGLTAAEVSRRAGIAPAAMSRLESGRNANPTFETLVRYASAIGVDLELVVHDRDTAAAARAPRAAETVESIRAALTTALHALDGLHVPC